MSEEDPLDRLLEAYVDQHLATGFPPDLMVLCEDHPRLLPDLAKLVRSYHQLDGSFGMPAKDLSGRALGPFRLLGLLGRGAVSEIYQALDVRGGKRVALKLFPAHLLVELGVTQDGKDLETALGPLVRSTSRAFPELHDAGREQGLCYLSMERVEGEALSAIDDLELTRSRLRLLAEAVAEVHAAGLVLGDLAPGTVLVRDQALRVLPWGVSTLRSGRRELATNPAGLHDLAFAAPEQISGEEDSSVSSPASDVFSLATLAAFVHLGQSPFEGLSRHGIAEKLHTAESVDLPGDIEERGLGDLLRVCWCQESSVRPTASEFLSRLEDSR